MGTHDGEYREALALAESADRKSIEYHWKMGELFARHHEAAADIALAIGKSVGYVYDHLLIYRQVPTAEKLAQLLKLRDDIAVWTHLLAWVKEAGPAGGDAKDDARRKRQPKTRTQPSQGGIVITVPAHVIKALADQSANPREVMTNFFRNASAQMLIQVAYPDRVLVTTGADTR